MRVSSVRRICNVAREFPSMCKNNIQSNHFRYFSHPIKRLSSTSMAEGAGFKLYALEVSPSNNDRVLVPIIEDEEYINGFEGGSLPPPLVTVLEGNSESKCFMVYQPSKNKMAVKQWRHSHMKKSLRDLNNSDTDSTSGILEDEIIDSCSICNMDMRPSSRPVALPCDHSFHEDCMWQWFKENSTCPICRHDVGGDMIGTGSPLQMKSQAKVVELFIEAGSNLDASGPSGQTALHVAARRGLRTLATQLISAGANVNCTDAKGCTPCDLARVHGKPACARLLEAAGGLKPSVDPAALKGRALVVEGLGRGVVVDLPRRSLRRLLIGLCMHLPHKAVVRFDDETVGSRKVNLRCRSVDGLRYSFSDLIV